MDELQRQKHIEDQQAAQNLEQSLLKRAVELEENSQDYYIHSVNSDIFEKEDHRIKHQKDVGLKDVLETVRKQMPEKYALMDLVRSSPNEDMRKAPLHHSRGQKLLASGDTASVLEFDMAGSGFQQFRKEKHGFHGHGTFKINGKDFKPDEDEKMEELIRVRAWNRSRWLNWIPGIKTEAQIMEKNRKIRERNSQREDRNTKRWLARTAIEAEYGSQVEITGEKRKHIRKKEYIEDGKKLTRISMAGPLTLGGASNSGEYSIENLRGYMLVIAKEYLSNIMNGWAGPQDCRNIPIIIKGHSRGAVAAAEGAMMIKKWVSENYPDYEKYVKFELIQYDPVPGIGSSFGVNDEFSHTHDRDYIKSNDVMKPLGAEAETTVIYSLHSEHAIGFTPQAVKGAKRVVLTPFKHGVGLDQVDTSAVRQNRQTKATRQSHSASFTDSRSGEVYRGSGINELQEGVYIVDEYNTLIRFDKYEDAVSIINSVISGTLFQGARHDKILDVVRAWFEAHT